MAQIGLMDVFIYIMGMNNNQIDAKYTTKPIQEK